MLPRQISSHVRRRLTQYHTLRWHETLEEHMSSLDQGRKKFHGLQCSGSSCLSQAKATQSSSPAGSFWTTITARTTTSVSTVRTCIWWWPCCAACATCSIMRVSASSWLHGASELTSSCCGTQITCSLPQCEHSPGTREAGTLV